MTSSTPPSSPPKKTKPSPTSLKTLLQHLSPLYKKFKKNILFDLIVLRFIKGLGLGYGLVVVGSVVRQLMRGKGVNLKENHGAAKTAALFFGISRVVLRGCLVGFGVVDGTAKYPKLATFMSGALAGTSFSLITDNDNSQSAIALYILIRACQLLFQSLWEKFNLPEIKNLDAIIFISSCTEIMHAWFYHQHTIPVVYARWITKMAKMDPTMLHLLKDMKEEKLQYGKRSDFLINWCKRHNLEPTSADFLSRPIPCCVVHPQDGNSCWRNSLRRSYNGVIPSLLIYTPVHLLPPLLLNPQSFIDSPLGSLMKVGGRVLQSTTFLSAFIGMVWSMVCLVRNSSVADRREYWGPLLGCFFCGFSIFIENKSRRMELALKVLADALTSVWRRGETAGVVKSIPRSDIAFFSVGLGIICSYYHGNRDMMRSSVRGIYGTFFE